MTLSKHRRSKNSAAPYKRTFVLAFILFTTSACQISKFSSYFNAPSNGSEVSLKKLTPRASIGHELHIVSASYHLDLSEQVRVGGDSTSPQEDQRYRLKTLIHLKSSQPNEKKEAKISLRIPSELAQRLKVDMGCIKIKTENVDHDDQKLITFGCSPNLEGEYVLSLTDDASLEQLVGRESIVEGERVYHLVYLPVSLSSKLFVGFNSNSKFPRQITVSASKKLRLFGHGLSANTEFTSETLGGTEVQQEQNNKHRSEDKKSDERIQLTWSNTESDEPFPLFFGFGSWETPSDLLVPFELYREGGARAKLQQTSTLITPLGSRHHRVGQQSLKQLQANTIKEHAERLAPLWSDRLMDDREVEKQLTKEQPLLWVSLPSHSGYTPPDLRDQGVIFVDESWFFKHNRFADVMNINDQVLLYNHLYYSLQSRLLTTSDRRFLSAVSGWRALSHVGNYNEQSNSIAPRHSIFQTRALEGIAANKIGPINKSQASYDELFSGVLKMLSSWISHRRESRLEISMIYKRLELVIGQTLLATKSKSKSNEHISLFGYQLNQLDNHLKQILESYLNHSGLPLVYVKWTQKQRGDQYDIRFTLSQSAFSPNAKDSELTPSMWVIPVCLKLGIKDNPPRAHCVLLDQPERSDYELTLEAPLTWVHPNLEQNGFYLWSVDQQAFEALIKAKELSMNEFLALPEMASTLLVTPQGSPTLYLQSVKQLALSPDHPLSLDLLFTHLNQIVLYFGRNGGESGLAELWASGILQGVMMSKAHLTQAPLNHLTQLQLAQWDPAEVGVGLRSVTKEERSQISKFLRPTSNQEAIEDDVAKVKLHQIQYPLLISSLSGDQKLWDKLYRKLAESDDQPLSRLLIIQAMVQFMSPKLFEKTLELLIRQVEEPMNETNVQEREEIEALDEAEVAEEQDKTDEQGHDHSDDETDESVAQVSLQVEDVLELVRAVRSPRAKQLAWHWLMRRAKEENHSNRTEKFTSIERLINYGERLDLQSALLAWGGAICDSNSIKQLEAIYREGLLSMHQKALEQTKDHLRRAKRCVKLRTLKGNTEAWIKKSLEGQ